MAFFSPRFLIFLLALLALLALPIGRERKKHVLTVASCLFYAAWDWRYLGLLLFVSVVDYVCAEKIHQTSVPGRRRNILLLSLISNLGLLAYFKYYNFFVDNLNGVLSQVGWHLPAKQILLPAGISFYTFKTLSYTIDVYRRHIVPCRSWLDYTTFITFFPELIAGPIVRASVFLPQLTQRIGPTADRMRSGASLFLLGLTKKLLIADRMALIADPMFAAPGDYCGVSLWMGAVAYSLQIYCDFSGYSDMAIGTAKMIGYDLPENFRMPYLSTNITEFWRRWHMTLSFWLRDYLYIPLGGNRRGRTRTHLNLLTTMVLGGLWHGASWNFIIWGFLHGAALVVDKVLSERKAQGARRSPFGIPLTFLFVVVCWVPFRAPSADAALEMLKRMFTLTDSGARFYPVTLVAGVLLMAIGHAIGVLCEKAASDVAFREQRLAPLLARFCARLDRNDVSGWQVTLGVGTVAGAFLLTFWLGVLFFFAATGGSPFIYFQF